MKRLLGILLALVILLGALTSCSSAPKKEDVKGRLTELIEASYGVNDLLFGEGPDTYERVEDPKASMKYFEAEGGQRYYYFYIDDAEAGRILAYRTRAYGDDYEYLAVSEAEREGEVPVYFDGENYYYAVEYVYRELEFYYDESFPQNYEVIRFDEDVKSVLEIKDYAAGVYSADYLRAIYETLFEGVMISEDTESGLLTARYIEFEDSEGARWFMKSTDYEAPMTEKRIFDLSTATVARGSSKQRLRIDVESYLESAPENRLTVTLNLVMQDGEWYLDNGTY